MGGGEGHKRVNKLNETQQEEEGKVGMKQKRNEPTDN